MAKIKGFSVIEGLKGKLGNVVVQKGQYGEQVVRSYVAEIKNPKSIAQSNQRMKVAPAQYARRTMQSIVDHSYEGVSYGTKSLNHFLSLAMKSNATPAQRKGNNKFIPGKYVMSTGSLPSVGFTYVAPDGEGKSSKFVSTLKMDGGSNLNKISTLSADVLNKNSWLTEGDVLTMCWVVGMKINEGFSYIFKRERITLDLNNQNSVPSELLNLIAASDGGVLSVTGSTNDLDGVHAVCIIVSRQSGSNWLRSDSTMVVSHWIEEQYFSAQAISDAVKSYMAAQKSITSDYYMNASEANILRGVIYNISELTSFPQMLEDLALAKIAGAVINKDGIPTNAVFVKNWNGSTGIIVDTMGNPFSYGEGNEATTDYINTGYDFISWSDNDYLLYQ